MVVRMSVSAYKWFEANQIYDIHTVNAVIPTENIRLLYPVPFNFFSQIRNRRIKTVHPYSEASQWQFLGLSVGWLKIHQFHKICNSVRLSRLKTRFLASYSSVDNSVCRYILIHGWPLCFCWYTYLIVLVLLCLFVYLCIHYYQIYGE